MSRELVCSVGMKDIEIQPFVASGPGGQKRNKTATAIRLIHHASGARAEAKEHKSQHQNKVAAFRRLAKTDKFLQWAKIKAGVSMAIDSAVDAAMEPRNLRVEVGGTGNWGPEE